MIGDADKILDSKRDRRLSVYSKEKRMRAIELYIKYDKSAAAVIHELGYPFRHLLPRWYKAYLKELLAY